jgi:hypothetical protein
MTVWAVTSQLLSCVFRVTSEVVSSVSSGWGRREVHASITFGERNVSVGGAARTGWEGFTVESRTRKRVKVLAAAAAAGAFVAIGAAATVAVSQQQTGTLIGGPTVVGQPATTTTTPPSAPPTAKAVPVMTATRPSGF